jgi:Zn-dependent peptidase ImmA (M78 family)
MHELGHLVLQDGAMCDAEVMGDVRFNPIEVWCNEFAAELLVPTEDFEPRAREYPYNSEWPREALRELANRYKVSQEVIYRKLLTLGRTTQEAYQKWRDAYRPPEQPKKSTGGPEWPVRVVSNSGRTFVALALAAYTTNQITASTLAGHLGAKLKHLPRIQELVWSVVGE